MLQRYNLYSKKLYIKNSKGNASLKPGLIWAGYKVIQSSPGNKKIRKNLKLRVLRILISDPVGIQTQDLQNRNLSA
jgi:hypothetical protein